MFVPDCLHAGRAYPSVFRSTKSGSGTRSQAQYPGHPNSAAISGFALEGFPLQIRTLGRNFEEKVSFGDDAWLISFGAPWVCGDMATTVLLLLFFFQ